MISTEISPDVSVLVETLAAVSPGATITYARLSEAIGRNVKTCYWLVMTAQKVAAKDHGAVFANERSVGFRRLTTEEYHQVGHTARRAIRRKSTRAARLIKQGAAKSNDISNSAARKINAELSALALIEYAAKDSLAKPTPTHDLRPEPVAVVAHRMLDAITGNTGSPQHAP